MARKNFHHPFEPYDIQQEFMEAVYLCIEDGQVGIFESPTGTGKSLSLICGSLTWLRQHKRRAFDEAVAAIQLDDDEPEWMVEHAKETRLRDLHQMRADFEARLDAVRQRELQVRERNTEGPPQKRRKKIDTDNSSSDADDEQYALDDYESDDDLRRQGTTQSDYSSETTRLMQKLGMLRGEDQNRDTAEDMDEPKIFFCSRTHSQLSQFVGELRRVKLPPGLPSASGKDAPIEELKHLTLGSRKNLCINSKVNKLASQTAINERCMELQQANTPLDEKCPYLPSKENEDALLDFRDHALAKIRDIEDLASVGTKLQICPYYASRPAINPAEIVTLPYPLLLQKSSRDALGISLKGHIVIVDEAHNLMNAVESMHSTQITSLQLTHARESLIQYLQRFRNRLKGSNRLYVTQLVLVLNSLLLFTSGLKSRHAFAGNLQPQELLSRKGVDQVNMSRLVRYINDSRLARKVEGYVVHLKQSQNVNGSASTNPPDTPTLTRVQNFLITLMNPSKEGRFFWAREGDTFVLRYLLLDPSEHFREVVENARAVILAGGTMSPMDEYKQQLFPYLSTIETLSCGHLMPPSNLLVRIISSNQEGLLQFSFKTRNQPAAAARIGRALLDIAPHIKGGLVVFFPSYGYLEQVHDQWKQGALLDKLQKVKPLFSDNRGGSALDTFKAYSQTIESDPRGAVLLSVIGGKLSEGINFSDDLGRCVVVIGLPFPNLETPEWKAKMEYIDEKAVARGEPRGQASREHAENVCMRSVNQAIGRVIRHKNDWASILLMDSRYTQARIKAKLPGWIKESLPNQDAPRASGLHQVSKEVASFFGSKKR